MKIERKRELSFCVIYFVIWIGSALRFKVKYSRREKKIWGFVCKRP